MRFLSTLMIAALVLGMGATAIAELQNVEVGGSLRIRGNMFDMDDEPTMVRTNPYHWPFHAKRARTYVDNSFIESRTRLNVKADFTDDVSAFIELDSYDAWGEDFRSNYVTGIDGRANSSDDVEVYQAYIEARDMWGTPLVMRVGRQELSLGSEWLVGTNDSSAFFTGLSFDALTLNYATDMFSVTGIVSKLAENFGDWGNDDADLYAIYGSYLGLEDIVIDAYWMFVRDETWGFDDDDSNLHTIGLRGAGTIDAFDFESEIAYQFGDADIDGPWWWNQKVDFDEWALNLELGYSFDMTWQPRVYAGFAYLGGGDDNESPWWKFWEYGNYTAAFNRLFSNWEYSEFLANTDLSNALIYRLGVNAQPTEAITLTLCGAYFQVDQEEEWGNGWFHTWTGDDDLGWELGLYGDYQYSEDLVFRAGWAHYFAGNALNDNANVWANGYAALVGQDDDDYDYLFIETELKF